MKKKVGMTLAALLAAAVVLSVTAHGAEPPQAVIGSGDGGTAISITDITPREGENKEDSENDTKNYTVSSYYPVSVQTAEEGGVQLLVKTFLVPPDTAPTELIEKDLTRRGVAYEVTDILRQEQPGETEKKTVSQAVTLVPLLETLLSCFPRKDIQKQLEYLLAALRVPPGQLVEQIIGVALQKRISEGNHLEPPPKPLVQFFHQGLINVTANVPV